jgi:hypothetical protein
MISFIQKIKNLKENPPSLITKLKKVVFFKFKLPRPVYKMWPWMCIVLGIIFIVFTNHKVIPVSLFAYSSNIMHMRYSFQQNITVT